MLVEYNRLHSQSQIPLESLNLCRRKPKATPHNKLQTARSRRNKMWMRLFKT